MKTYFMCAGRGDRLGKLTKDNPKCMMKVCGKTMLYRWVTKFGEWRVKDVLINMSSHTGKILSHLDEVDWGRVRISLSKEKEPIGSAATLYNNRGFVRGEHYFAVVYSDVWTSFDLRKMINFHKKRPSMVTLGLHTPRSLDGKGVAIVKNGVVVGFEEKPQTPKSRTVWAGILIAHPSIFKLMNQDMKDIATDLLPKLAETGRMQAFFINEPLWDIGESEDSYEFVCNETQKLGLGAL